MTAEEGSGSSGGGGKKYTLDDKSTVTKASVGNKTVMKSGDPVALTKAEVSSLEGIEGVVLTEA